MAQTEPRSDQASRAGTDGARGLHPCGQPAGPVAGAAAANPSSESPTGSSGDPAPERRSGVVAPLHPQGVRTKTRPPTSRPRHQLEPLVEAVLRLLPATTESQILILWGHQPPQPSTSLEIVQLLLVGLYPLVLLGDAVANQRFDWSLDFVWYLLAAGFVGVLYYTLIELTLAWMRPRPLRGRYEIEIHRPLETVKIVDHLAGRRTEVLRFADLRDLVISGLPVGYDQVRLEVELEIGDFVLILDDMPTLPMTGEGVRPDPDVRFLRRVLSLSEWTARPLRLCLHNEPLGMKFCTPGQPTPPPRPWPPERFRR